MALEISSAEPGSAVSGEASVWAQTADAKSDSAKNKIGMRTKRILQIRDEKRMKQERWECTTSGNEAGRSQLVGNRIAPAVLAATAGSASRVASGRRRRRVSPRYEAS